MIKSFFAKADGIGMWTDLIGSVKAKACDAFSLTVGNGLKAIQIVDEAGAVSAKAEDRVIVDAPVLTLTDIANFFEIEIHKALQLIVSQNKINLVLVKGRVGNDWHRLVESADALFKPGNVSPLTEFVACSMKSSDISKSESLVHCNTVCVGVGDAGIEISDSLKL